MPKKLTEQQKKSRLRKRAVTMAKRIVREKSGFRCVKCGKGEPLNQTQGSHILPEGRYPGMSADLDNILCLCAGCHMWSSDSWHENPLAAAEFFHERYPGLYDTLKERAKDTTPKDSTFWERKIEYLKSL